VTRYRVARLVRAGLLDTVPTGRYRSVTHASLRRFVSQTMGDEAPSLRGGNKPTSPRAARKAPSKLAHHLAAA